VKLAVNVRSLVPSQTGGAEELLRNTVGALLDLEQAPRITLLTSYHNHHTFSAWRDRVRLVYVPEERRQICMPKILAENDVLWCPFLFLEPENPGIPAVVSIPDLQHLDHPEFFSREMLAVRLRGFRIGTARAQYILTPSAYSKRRLLDYYHMPEERVVVVPPGYSGDYGDPPDRERRAAVRKRYDLPDEYGIYPANNWAHKNHRGLFRALAAYRERFGETVPILLTGSMVPGGLDLRSEAEDAGVEDLVRHIGYVDSSEMPHLYDGAAFLVYPSLFEGFGIPVFEAMVRGTPVIAANRTSLPELVGDCGTLVDPECPDALALAMRDVLSQTNTVVQRSACARDRALPHSYERTAARTLQVMADAIASTAPITLPGVSPKVFIVTPSLNQGRFLRETIESVLSQDYPVDYMVADGGSTDETIDILESYGDRVRWVSEPDGGQAAAIAAAWRDSDAEIVAWLNSDDTLLDGAVSAAVDFLTHHPDTAMVYGRAWYTDIEGRFTEPYPTRAFDPELLARECFVCQPAAFLRREVFQVIELPDPELRYCMDYDLWIRLSRSFDIDYLDRFLATSRIHPQAKTIAERDPVYRETMEVVRRHFGSVPRTWTAGYLSFRAKRAFDRFRWLIPRPVQRRLYSFLMHRRQVYGPSAPYADGWVSRRTVHHVRLDEDGWVTIFGSSPHWPLEMPLTIQVLVDGEVVGSQQLSERGDFLIQVRVRNQRLVPAALELLASASYVPKKFGLGDDDRSVAFKVRSILAGRHAELSAT
jgi:glycosyltransferase involved in cell wall biosynthesis